MAAQTFRFTYKSNADMKAKAAAASVLAQDDEKVVVKYQGNGDEANGQDWWDLNDTVTKMGSKYLTIETLEEGIAVIKPTGRSNQPRYTIEIVKRF